MIVIGLAFAIKIPVILHSGYFNNARKTSVLPATSNVLKSKKKVLVLFKPETPVKFIIDLARSELLKLKELSIEFETKFAINCLSTPVENKSTVIPENDCEFICAPFDNAKDSGSFTERLKSKTD